ncbi:MAG: hypothetical protein R6V85_14425 [Polyangia bacterium]
MSFDPSRATELSSGRAALLLAIVLVAACCECSCDGRPDRGRAERRSAPAEPVADAGESGEPPAPTCAERIQALAHAWPPPSLEAHREALPEISIRTRAAPFLFLERPEPPPRDSEAGRIRRALVEERFPDRALRRLLRRSRDDRELLRRVVLCDGYLYSERPALARALVARIELDDLFDRDEIFMHERGELRRLTRRGDDYVDAEGVRQSIVLGDRVAADPARLEEPLHLDLGAVRRETGAQRVVPLRFEPGRAGVRLVFPDGYEAEALIEADGPRTRVVCISGSARRLESARRDARRFWRWIDRIRDAAESMVEDRPGFDEPVDEPEGEQEDGELRHEWLKAYYRGRRHFVFRQEEYRVYNYRGRPTPPQVCIDFIFDTLERASGRWFEGRRKRPGLSPGFVDFSSLEGLQRRQTPSALEYAALPETPIERFDVPPDLRVPFRQGQRFAKAVARISDRIREGDVLVIHGLREEDMELHYHTVLVLRCDPLTGVPTLVAGNAGRPRIRSLAAAMRSAPRRMIKHRLRIDDDWVESRRRLFEQSRDAGIADTGDQEKAQ